MKRAYQRYGIYLLELAIISELILPFVLAFMYPEFDHITMLISEFGNANEQTKLIFRVWMFINGGLFIASSIAVYRRFALSNSFYALILSLSITVFGVGDCILTSLFETSATGNAHTLSEKIHDMGSAVGFAALLIGVVVLIKLYHIEKQKLLVSIIGVCLFFSLFFMLLYSMKRIPILKTYDLPYRGLWQRLNLLFMYLPYLIMVFESTFNRMKRGNWNE